MLPATTAGLLLGCLVLAPVASASAGHAGPPIAIFGIPSLHSIIEAIAKGFFSTLAGALVPGFLKHGTVATVQSLVALPDPARWGHVSELEGDMTYLGMSLMPVTLTVCTLRYWIMGLTGSAHPVSAVARCALATAVLVMYRWIVEQIVAVTNTLTHAILGFHVVAGGLGSVLKILFDGPLLVGGGGVFGAALVIVGVVFGASLFACKVALTVLLALAFCGGPPVIALAPIPELLHLLRAWWHALLAVVLVPIGWTLLFAVAGALALDTTSFSGGASGGLPGHIQAAFAGLITFVFAVKLPMMLLGELRHSLGGVGLRGGGTGAGARQPETPGSDRVKIARARIIDAAVRGAPSLGRSLGRAAGALGAPAGGPVGAARRGLAGAARRTGVPSGPSAGAGTAALAGAAAGGAAGGGRRGVRGRLARSGKILAGAPRDALEAMDSHPSDVSRAAERVAAAGARARRRNGSRESASTDGASTKSGGTQPQSPIPNTSGPASGEPSRKSAPGSATRPPAKRPSSANPSGEPPSPGKTSPGTGDSAHPARKVQDSAPRQAATTGSPSPAASKPQQRETKPIAPTGQPQATAIKTPPVPATPKRKRKRSPRSKP